MKRKNSRNPGTGALLVCVLLFLSIFLIPSSRPVDSYSDMIAAPTPAPEARGTVKLYTTVVPEATIAPTAVPVATVAPAAVPVATVAPTAVPVATVAPTAVPVATVAPTAVPEATVAPAAVPEASVAPTAVPEATIAPEKSVLAGLPGEVFDPRGDGSAIKRLPMDDFSPGTPPLPEGYADNRRTYSDESITVTIYQEKINATIYTVADVTIADVSQLRTALAGTMSSPARSHMSKLAARVNAIVAIDGDYYADRKGAYVVRQSTLLADSFASDLDLLIIDTAGDLHCVAASEKEQAVAAMRDDIYQCFSFGPILVKDGQKVAIPEEYQFGCMWLNPRAGVGQLGELHYLLVVASGRIPESLAITVETLRDYMYEKGCIQAYAVDGGASAELYFDGDSASPLTDSGERGLYDILYFASTAGEQ